MAELFPRVAVGAVVFRDNAVLLVKRGKSPSKGEWTIPGGRVEPGETLKEAAEREILEETSIVVSAGEPVYIFELIDKDERDILTFHYVVVDLEAEYVSGDICAGDDAEDARWVRREDMSGLNVNSETVRALEKVFGF